MFEPGVGIVFENNAGSEERNDSSNIVKPSDISTSNPDKDCLFDPDLPKCAAVNGKCPDGFYQNEDEQFVPKGGCLKDI